LSYGRIVGLELGLVELVLDLGLELGRSLWFHWFWFGENVWGKMSRRVSNTYEMNLILEYRPKLSELCTHCSSG